MLNREVICNNAEFHSSWLKTALPLSTMGFGWTEIAAKLNRSIMDLPQLRKKDAYHFIKQIDIEVFFIYMLYAFYTMIIVSI